MKTYKDYDFNAAVLLPTDASAPVNRQVWIDTATGKMCFKIGGLTVSVPLASEIGSVSVSDTATADLTFTSGTLTVDVLDSPKLEGNTFAQVQAAIISAISNGAGAAYDTLLELENLLISEDSAVSALTTAVSARAKFYAGTVPDGATTANIDHNLGLTNIHDFTAKVFVSATGVQEEYAMVGSTSNRVILTDESGANIASGRRIFLTAGA